MEQNYDRKKELQEFDETKAGAKGLADSGISRIPRIFYHPQDHSVKESKSKELEQAFPVIDLDGFGKGMAEHRDIVSKVRDASEKWGFFQVVNHGIPVSVLEEMVAGVHRFFDQDIEIRKEWYNRDFTKKRVSYSCNFDLFRSPAANWRDTVTCVMAPDPPKPHQLPQVCRDIMAEYSKEVMKLGDALLKILSEALGLDQNHLNNIGCNEGLAVVCNYYPRCPEPDLTLGSSRHSDPDFLTVLLQDHIGGLQVLHDNQWVQVPPLPGALVVNIGDLLQLISNDKFISAEHRVVANDVDARVSVAGFFRNVDKSPNAKVYGPIQELMSEQNTPKYKAITTAEFSSYYNSKGLDGTSALSHFRV